MESCQIIRFTLLMSNCTSSRLDRSLLASHILLKVALFCTAYHLHKTLKELSGIYKHLGIVYMQNILAFSHDPVYHHHHLFIILLDCDFELNCPMRQCEIVTNMHM